ncbi:unnamed protein product [Choristocarpus tenellus]
MFTEIYVEDLNMIHCPLVEMHLILHSPRHIIHTYIQAYRHTGMYLLFVCVVLKMFYFLIINSEGLSLLPSLLHSCRLISMKSGLSVLKTPLCSQDHYRMWHCPTCSDDGRALGRDMPFAHHGHSNLVCPQSGAPMDGENPPLALPNGRVFGSRFLQAMGQASGGVITCPVTGEEFRFDQLRHVYII